MINSAQKKIIKNNINKKKIMKNLIKNTIKKSIFHNLSLTSSNRLLNKIYIKQAGNKVRKICINSGSYKSVNKTLNLNRHIINRKVKEGQLTLAQVLSW